MIPLWAWLGVASFVGFWLFMVWGFVWCGIQDDGREGWEDGYYYD